MTESKLPKFMIWKSSKLAIVLLGTTLSLPLIFGVSIKPAEAAPLLRTNQILDQNINDAPVIDVRAVVRRGGAVVGPRGGVAYRSRTVVRGGRGAVVRGGGAVVRRGAWARPARYWWRPGGAIAAGAALGFVTAATAAAWAGSPPAPGYCWYYTDASRQQGFWDACP
jgi:hypothetical protein